MQPPIDQQVPGVYHRRLGTLLVTTVSDGYVDLSWEAVRGLSPAEARHMAEDATGQPGAPGGARADVNMFALRGGGRTVLIDAGSGTTMGPTCGRLPDSLRQAGIDPAEVDAVLLTHMHPDHSNGLTSDAGVALFPRAEVVVHADEVAHWFDDAAMARADDRARARYFEAARFRLAPYRGRVRTFRDGEVLPGIEGVPCPGHTPGHCAFRIRSEAEELLVWGDAVHVPEVQVPRPDIFMMFDYDGPAAAASRRAMLDLAVRDRLPVGGMHLHFPGFARMARDGEGFRLLPEPWCYEV